MIGKKINQLATELAPVSTDLTIIGDPTTGVSKKITLAQLGAIFSGAVSFYTDLASFPATGDINVIYCAKDTQKLYLWSGSAYVEVFPSQALLDTYQLRSEKGNANGYASLDSQGKVPISQLPSSIMEYKGTWNASTNTPTLANGTGDTGDVYICNVAGTVNFGAGAITFAVGDYVIYSGTIWQRSSGAVGTVTSVAVSRSGDALAITGSPVTTSGTINIGFAGNSTQYINGAGNLVTFPGVINEAQNLITEVYNKTGATLTKGTVVYINGGQGNLPAVTKALATGDSTSAQTYGIVRNDITNNNNGYVVVAGRISDLDTQAYTEGTQLYLSPTTAGTFTSTKPYAPQHLVYVGIVVRAHPTQGVVEVKIQNGYELDELHNVAAQTPSNNDGLFWEASTSLWKNKSISTIIGGSPVYGSGTTNYITKWSATSGELINSSLVDIGGTIYNALTNAGQFAWQFNGDTTTGQSYGALINAGTNASDIALRIQNASSTSVYFYVWGDGKVQINNIPNATTDTDKFLVSDSGVIKYRTGAELLSDIGGASASGYVPYTGATANLNLGANDLLSRSVYIEGTASFQAGLLMKQLSVYNFVTGAYTQIAPSTATELNIVHNQANTTRRRYALSVAALQDGDSFQYLVPRKDGTFAMTSDIPSLTGYVQGTGTTNYLPKFTGTSTIGNSLVYDDGTNVGINRNNPTRTLDILGGSGIGTVLKLEGASGTTTYLQLAYNGATNSQSGYIGYNSSSQMQFFTNNTLRATIDASGNLGLGVTPSAWNTGYRAMQITSWSSIASDFAFNGATEILTNAYIGTASASNYIYTNSAASTRYKQVDGIHSWSNAPSGTAGNAISFTQAMTLDASGNLFVGATTSAAGKLIVKDTGSSNHIWLIGRTSDGSSSVSFRNAADSSYAARIEASPSSGLFIETSGTERFRIASTGAATFSSSVTAGKITTSGAASLPSSSALSESIVLIQDSGSNRRLGIGSSTSGQWIQSSYPGVEGIASTLLLNPLGGNVGIGTTSPSSPLAIKGSANNTVVEFGNASTSNGYMLFFDRTASAYASGYVDALDFSVRTSNTERMRINTNGNVGIGTTNSSYPLNVYKAGSNVFSTVYNVAAFNDGTASYKGINLGYLSGEQTGVIYAETNSAASNLAFWTYSGSAWGERMRITSAGNVVIGNTVASNVGLTIYGSNAATIYQTANTGTGASNGFYVGHAGDVSYIWNYNNYPTVFATNNTERMRITSGGAIAMNQSTTYGAETLEITGLISGGAQYGILMSGNPASYTNYAMRFHYTGVAVVGSITFNTTSTAYNTSSDYRLKQDLKDFNGLDLVSKLKAYDYEWKSDKSRSYGVIAHELQSVINYAVTGVKDGKEMQGVDYSKIVPVLIKAIQELNDKIK